MIVPVDSTAARLILDREVAGDLQLAVLTDSIWSDSKRISGIALGVEELGRAEVGPEVLVLDLDRADLDGAREARAAVIVDGQRRVEVLEAAAEGRDDHVLDGEAGARVHGVEPVGAGGNGARAAGDLNC